MTRTSRTRRWWARMLVGGPLLLLIPGTSVAASGVEPGALVFGQSACFSGPNRNLGIHYRSGILAAFRERNVRGGINGRLLELRALDDGYEPEAAAANAARFAAEDDVFAVIGGVGTPTARRIAPVLRTAGIPFVGHVTGADFLRNAERFPNVINLRAGYFDETRMLVEHIVRDLGKRRLGIIYQDDAFGRSVLRNFRTILGDHDLPLLAKTAYTRNTHAVHASLFSLEKAHLDAILLVGAYAANSKIINLSRALGHEYIMANLSFVLSYELRRRLDTRGARVLVTEVMPDATDASLEIVRSYQSALRAEYEAQNDSSPPGFNELSLEGYLLGRFVTAVVERMGGELTRQNFLIQALSSGPVSVDDWTFEFQPGTNTGSTYIRLVDLGG